MVKRKESFSDEDLEKIALKHGKNIHLLSKEHAFTVDADGTIHKCPAGNDGGVDVSIELAKSAKIIVHNHPNDFKEPASFSGIDVYHLLHLRLNEIIVCSYGYYFAMKNENCSTLSSEVKRDLEKEYKRIETRLYKEFIRDTSALERSIAAKYRKFRVSVEKEYHEFLTKYAHEKGLSYHKGKL